MNPLDRFLPDFTFNEIHARGVGAQRDALMQAALDYRPDDDPFFRAMIGLREIPMRLLRRLRKTPPSPSFGLDNFTLLERPGDALVYGLVGRFWESDYGLVSIADAQAFRDCQASGVAKLALAIWTEPRNGALRLVTETRILCPDAATRRRFAPYWYLIRPVSGMIRGRILRSIARDAMRHGPPIQD